MLLYLLCAFLFGAITQPQPIAPAGIITEWKGKIDDIFIYIGTLDGFFHCVNVLTGEALWSVDTEGYIFGSTETEERTFIPSLDGYLFTYFNEFGYKRIPLPIRDLVFMSPFRTENGVIFTSEKSTSIFFINDSGNVTLTYHSNSTNPTKNDFPAKNSDDLVVVRINYLLNVIDETSKIIKFSEFDIFTGSNSCDAQQDVTVTTSFSGSVLITVNGTVTAQFKINGIPTSVYGSSGKFDFKMNIDNDQADSDQYDNSFNVDSMAVFVELEGNSIAIPSRPSSPYETVATQTEAERSRSSVDIASQVQNQNMMNHNKYPYIMQLPYGEIPVGLTYLKSECVGLNGERLPCVIVTTQSKSTTQSSSPDEVSVETTVTTTLTLMPITHNEYYPFIACTLFLTYVILMTLKYIKENHIKNTASQIIIDDNDQTIGYFNNVQCSILTTSTVDETVLKKLSELNIQYTVQIRTFEKLKDQNERKNNANCEFRICCQPLNPFKFDNLVVRQKQNNHSIKITYRNDKNYYNNNDNNNNDNDIENISKNSIDDQFCLEITNNSQKQIQSFLKRTMIVLSTLFKNGFVHGEINTDCIYSDSDGEPLLGGFEKKCHASKSQEEHEADILSVAQLIYQVISQKCKDKLKTDIINLFDVKNLIASFDPILYDLLEEMTCTDFNDRPTAEEVLLHPFFFTTSQKMKLLSHAKDFLEKKKNSIIYNIFNEKSSHISGENWTFYIDQRLLNEATMRSEYNGQLTSELVRFVRNKWEHPGFTSDGQKLVNEQYFNYFHKLFPNLFLYTYYFLDKYDFELV